MAYDENKTSSENAKDRGLSTGPWTSGTRHDMIKTLNSALGMGGDNVSDAECMQNPNG